MLVDADEGSGLNQEGDARLVANQAGHSPDAANVQRIKAALARAEAAAARFGHRHAALREATVESIAALDRLIEDAADG
jgi:hypothetical protein